MNSKSKWCSIDLGVAATHKKCSPPRGDSSDNQIFVGGLKLTVTDQQLHARFVQTFGDIAEARVMRFRDGRSRGFGFVKFNRSADYRRALDMQNMDFDGNLIEFRASISKEQAAKEAKELLKRKLILQSMPLDVTKSQLLDYFNMYGEIVRVKIFRDLQTDEPIGQGYVEFKAASSLELALAALKRKPLQINHQLVDVCSAQAKQAPNQHEVDHQNFNKSENFGFSTAITKLSLTNAPPSMTGLFSPKKSPFGQVSTATFRSTFEQTEPLHQQYRFNQNTLRGSSQSAKYYYLAARRAMVQARILI